MPEYPDICIYVEKLKTLLSGERLENFRVLNPFVLRSVSPSPAEFVDKKIVDFHRIGKRIIFECEDEFFVVVHLMVAGRFHWKDRDKNVARKVALAAFNFSKGTLWLTEASTQKRASIHCVKGKENLSKFDRGGLEVMDAAFDEFRERLCSENHTIKRSLTDPTLFSGIGNAYSDEILHRARLSPILQSQKMTDEQIEQLFQATKDVLAEWTERLRKENEDNFPEKVTAFHDKMAVHGKFGEPCPVCGTPIQRIRYASNETNYCSTCQTGGKILADRALSRLLKNDWPRSIEELEDRISE
ncbi:formamidopyrimidine-DNA glycosylase [candidate division KSB1 bacterium 4484_87]|nr:MAG: formamidopyrimidine-DNA glycosylase [candidate division KSB1 bacterium 4484_87]